MHIIFSHGKESGPWGSKIKSMAAVAEEYGQVHSLDYQDIACPEERVTRLICYAKSLEGEIVLVGSSMGAYVSTLASNELVVRKMLLLAPAFYLNGYKEQQPQSECQEIAIIHGWRDEVVPYANSVKFAANQTCELKLVNDNHHLSSSKRIINTELLLLLN